MQLSCTPLYNKSCLSYCRRRRRWPGEPPGLAQDAAKPGGPWAIPWGLIQVLRQHLLKLRIKSRAATSNGAEIPSQAGRYIVQLYGGDLSGPLLLQSCQACDLCKSSVVRLRLKTPAQACLQWNLLANSKGSVRSGLFRPNQHLYQFDYNSEGALLS